MYGIDVVERDWRNQERKTFSISLVSQPQEVNITYQRHRPRPTLCNSLPNDFQGK
jgi:hypothetical protein